MSDYYTVTTKSCFSVSFEFVPYSTLGQCYPNGSYDGIIGMIQRNEYSSFMVPVRYDSVPCEPGIFVESFHGAHAPKIYSTFNRIRNGTEKREIVFVVTSFNSSIWIYLIVAYTICGVILTAYAICLNQVELKRWPVVRHFFKSLGIFHAVHGHGSNGCIKVHGSNHSLDSSCHCCLLWVSLCIIQHTFS